MKIKVNAADWREYVPKMLSIAGTRNINHPLNGMVEIATLGDWCSVTSVSPGVTARMTIRASIEASGRAVVPASIVGLVAQGANNSITIAKDKSQVHFISKAFRASSGCSDVEFPKPQAQKDSRRKIALGASDVSAWAVAEEPSTLENARDTLWLGVTPLNRRLYVSCASGSWAACVRDGQDMAAVAAPASIIRKIKPAAGDVFSFHDKFIRIDRGFLSFEVSLLADWLKDAYPLMDNILGAVHSKVTLGPNELGELKSALRLAVQGSSEDKLVPTRLILNDGMIYVWCDGETKTRSFVPIQSVCGTPQWSIGVAGDAILATLGNIKDTAKIWVMDRPKEALVIWHEQVASIRAALRVDHPIPTMRELSALRRGDLSPGSTEEAEPEMEAEPTLDNSQDSPDSGEPVL